MKISIQSEWGRRNKMSKKKVNIIRSETWLIDDFKNNISQILNETITDFVEDNEKIINIEMITQKNGLSRFWIYTIAD